MTDKEETMSKAQELKLYQREHFDRKIDKKLEPEIEREELKLKTTVAKILEKGAVLITTRATIGNCAISNNKVATNQGFQNLEVNKNHNNKF